MKCWRNEATLMPRRLFWSHVIFFRHPIRSFCFVLFFMPLNIFLNNYFVEEKILIRNYFVRRHPIRNLKNADSNFASTEICYSSFAKAAWGKMGLRWDLWVIIRLYFSVAASYYGIFRLNLYNNLPILV